MVTPAATNSSGARDKHHLRTPDFEKSIRQLYAKDAGPGAAEVEIPIWLKNYEALKETLGAVGYRVREPFALGSSGVIFRVSDVNLRTERAMKILRPRLERFDRLLRLAERERWRLNELRHQNLVRLFYGADLQAVVAGRPDPIRLPFFIMELISPSVSLDEYVAGHATGKDDASDMLARIMLQIGNAIAYLHQQRVAHLDIKPRNILMSEGAPVIVDLGYAKTMNPKWRHVTGVMVTKEFVHPKLWELGEAAKTGKVEDPNAVPIDVPYREIRPAFDMYSYGRTILTTLASAGPETQASYGGRYLRLVGSRLLDGENTAEETAENLPVETNKQLRYDALVEALDDLGRLTGSMSRTAGVPELAPNLTDVVVLPPLGTRVPFTERVEMTVGSQQLVRLRQVSQLGLLNMVYPGATHSRWEHALGSFGMVCRMLIALDHDETSPLFRSIVRDKDIKAVMVAALFHDVGQYPLAHDLEDADDFFNHEHLSMLLLSDPAFTPPGEPSAENLIWELWGVRLKDVLAILNPEAGPTSRGFRETLLRRLISGPIDADKLDYLRRDAAHAGVA
jgi:serine/threonine protein kinase